MEPKTLKDHLIEELTCQETGSAATKDILVVVRDQPALTRACLESVVANTTDYHLYVWDNGSGPETKAVLDEFAQLPNFTRLTHPLNVGFIIPNNRMARLGGGEYLILLNNDCEVHSGWAEALTGWLQYHPECEAVSYQGGLLSEHGIGIGTNTGEEVDYLAGWCLCLRRSWWSRHGLFDEGNLRFAYGEDTDLCLRMREKGKSLYALNLEYVKHHAHQTTAAVKAERDMKADFAANHRYVQSRHADYLRTSRVLLRHPEVERLTLEQWKKDHGTDLTLEALVEKCL